jgi:superfamily II DNA or RNA helicase/HKD family nuclease
MAALITNLSQTMEQALMNTLPQAGRVDILTAYFYFSGFTLLADQLKDKHIRILVGKHIDPKKIDELSAAFRSHQHQNVDLDLYQNSKSFALGRTQRKNEYTEGFIGLYNKSALSQAFDDTESQNAHKIFEDKLRDGSLEIRMTSGVNHAKTFILTNKPEFSANGDAKGVVFMGSSNFTYSGLLGQGELNQRHSDNQNYDNFAEYFNSLWDDAEKTIDVSTKDSNDDFIKEIERRLWIHSKPAPYKIFIRILHELYRQNDEAGLKSPDSISGGKFTNLRYQLDAIKDGIDCINKNNGVIIADVVGLGKSVIAASIAHNLDIQRTIIIAPPHLIQQWNDYVQDFGIRGAVVESGGKIERVHERYAMSDNPVLYIIDEAHRYRNELTDDYQYLHQLTRSNAGNKVILLTATPYNNKPQDLFAMVKLFQTPSRSTIHSVDNLSMRFHQLIAEYRAIAKKGKKEMTAVIKEDLRKLSQELRLLIEPVIIRRSRIDLKQIQEYADDLKAQRISFPEVEGPLLIEYDLGSIRERYVGTLVKLTKPEEDKGFVGARYKSAAYLREDKRLEFIDKYKRFFDERDLKQAQINLADFMKRLLVMRFESSKYAFKSTLESIIASHKNIIKWWEKGFVPILKKGNLNAPEEFDLDELLENIERANNGEYDVDKIKKIAVPVPVPMLEEGFITDVKNDLKLLDEIYGEWFADGGVGDDPKFMKVKEEIAQRLEQNKNRKIVIFSSYADTAKWVSEQLKENGFERTLLYTGSSKSGDRIVVTRNFDASLKKSEQKDDFDIIVATDALSEGFNLHRAGIVINYDIPYNPTRVVQRIGRINRINKKVFDKIYILNFFPTDIGAPITNVKNISTLKMLLINSIIGSDTKTLTPDEDLQSYFKKVYVEADADNDESSWDNEYRNIYNAVKHNRQLLDEIMSIPERTRIVRTGRDAEIAVSFAKRGHGVLFALADKGDEEARIVSAEDALGYFKADLDEESLRGDLQLDAKFEALRKKITEPHKLPKIEGNRANAQKAILVLKNKVRSERDYLSDLYEVVNKYDDLSDGELKYISQLDLSVPEAAVAELKQTLSPHYLGVIKERAEAIDGATEIIMFTEDLRK